jgi:mannose/fructose-specific phosphotransferase system component IIA
MAAIVCCCLQTATLQHQAVSFSPKGGNVLEVITGLKLKLCYDVLQCAKQQQSCLDKV